MPQEHQVQGSGQVLGKQQAVFGRCCATAAGTGLSVSAAQGLLPLTQGAFLALSATPAHSPALPQAAPGPLVPLSHFCWPTVLSLTFAQLMILADVVGWLRLFLWGPVPVTTAQGTATIPALQSGPAGPHLLKSWEKKNQ